MSGAKNLFAIGWPLDFAERALFSQFALGNWGARFWKRRRAFFGRIGPRLPIQPLPRFRFVNPALLSPATGSQQQDSSNKKQNKNNLAAAP